MHQTFVQGDKYHWFVTELNNELYSPKWRADNSLPSYIIALMYAMVGVNEIHYSYLKSSES